MNNLSPKTDPLTFSISKDVATYGVGATQPVGQLVVEFANLLMDNRRTPNNFAHLASSVEEILANPKENIVNAVLPVAKRYGGDVFSYVVSLLAHDTYYKNTTEHYFWAVLNILSGFCRSYVLGKKFMTVTKDGVSLEAHFIVDRLGAMHMEFSSTSAEAIVMYHLFTLQELEQRPSVCSMCGRAFFPTSKSNEKYCRNIYKNGRTCADIAFEVQSKQDPFYDLYRTAYKTVSARVGRMIGKDAGQAKLKMWREAAKSALEEYRAKDDLEGFRKWIEESKK